jgi:hypothetical protein
MNMTEPNVKNQINAYFVAQGLPYTYEDVLRVRDMKVGNRPVSMQRQADELGGMSRSTLYGWYKKIDNA